MEGESVSSFVQWGHSAESCGLDRHLGGGLIWRGWLASRPGDALGFGITRVRAALRSAAAGEVEQVYAAYGRLGIAPNLALTPDIQVIRSSRVSAGTRLVATLRLSAAC